MLIVIGLILLVLGFLFSMSTVPVAGRVLMFFGAILLLAGLVLLAATGTHFHPGRL